MGLLVASVRNQRAPGAAATTLTDDIKFGFTATSLHLDTFGLLVASASDTYQGVVDEVTQVRYSDVNSNPVSTIDGDDLFNTLQHFGNEPFITNNALTVDNQPKAFSLMQPFSPFPNDPQKNFGLAPNKGVQFTVDWLADTTIDNRTYDLTVEGISADIKPTPLGAVRFIRDAYTAAVGEQNFTDITGTGSRLLGVSNWETTEYDALAASAAPDVTTIREQAILYSNDIKVGPYKTYRTWSMNRAKQAPLDAAGNGTTLNMGASFQNFGMQNASGRLGLDMANANIKIRTTGGAANAARVNAVILN